MSTRRTNKKFVLLIYSLAQFLVMQVWFSFSSVIPQLTSEWGLSSVQSGLIISVFHLGYVLSVFVNSFLSDKRNPSVLFVIGAFLAGLSSVFFSLLAEGFLSALVLRFLAGLGVGGIYVPGMKLLSSIFSPAERGKVIGFYVGSLVIGSGASLLVAGLFVDQIGWMGVVMVTGISACLGGLLAILPRLEPITKSNHSLSIHTVRNVLTKSNLLMNAGYAGHMWELYAMWAWIGPFFVMVFQNHHYSDQSANSYGNIIASVVIMSGALATWMGGALSDRIGRTRSILLFIGVSIMCSLTIGWFIMMPVWILVLIALLYGFSIIGDSPIYSTGLTELNEPDTVGFALGIQSVIGFSITVISPSVFGLILELCKGQPLYQWGFAFTVLGMGALITPYTMWKLRKLPESRRMAQGKR